MSQIEINERADAISPLACRFIYEAVLAAAGSHRSALLQARSNALAAQVRRAALRNPDVYALGHAARHWIKATFRQDDEALRRAAVAALALGLEARIAEWPAELLRLQPAAHARLAAFLSAKRPYGEERFARDVAFACGLSSPAGALSVSIPPAPGGAEPDGAALPRRARRAAGAFCRQVLQYGSAAAAAWLAEVGAQPWAEVHVDVRDLEDFNAEGFLRCYHRLAALMRARPDLAGVYGASWLYDPQIACISPGLAFVRRTAEDGGGRLLRLRATPVQTAFATARSPQRRRLVESGAYRPVCYAMFWTRAALLGAKGGGARVRGGGSKYLQVVLK